MTRLHVLLVVLLISVVALGVSSGDRFVDLYTTQTVAGAKTWSDAAVFSSTVAATGTVSGSNLSSTFTGSAGGSASGSNTGDQSFTVTAVGAGDAEGLSVSANAFTLHLATVTQPGAVSIAAQEFNGAKTFDDGWISDADVSMADTGSPLISFGAGGTAVPSFTTTSAGTKIVLYPEIDATHSNYGIGITANTMWFDVPIADGAHLFAWYAGTTEIARLSDAGALSLDAGADLGSTLTGTGAIFSADVDVNGNDLTSAGAWDLGNGGLIRADATTVGSFASICGAACPEGVDVGAYQPSVSGLRVARNTCTVITAGACAACTDAVQLSVEGTTCNLGAICASAAGTVATCDTAVVMAAGTTYDIQYTATTTCTTNPQLLCNHELALLVSP